ncbi:MAG: hypothetical protein AAGI06_13470 [Pseudomonadota bacterium]
MKPVLLRLRRILIGYMVAAFATGACVLGGATILAFVQKTMTGSGELAPFTHSVVSLVFLSVLLMVLGALPALAVGLIAEAMRIRHWLYYVLGGMLICLVMWRGLPFQGTGDFQFFLFAGALGGAVYWRIAGRKAGDWANAEDEEELNDEEPDEEELSVEHDTEASSEENKIRDLSTEPTEETETEVSSPHEAPSRPAHWVRSR